MAGFFLPQQQWEKGTAPSFATPLLGSCPPSLGVLLSLVVAQVLGGSIAPTREGKAIFFCPSLWSRWMCASLRSRCRHIFPCFEAPSESTAKLCLEIHCFQASVWPVLPSEVPSMKYTHALQGREICPTSLAGCWQATTCIRARLWQQPLNQRERRSSAKGKRGLRGALVQGMPCASSALLPPQAGEAHPASAAAAGHGLHVADGSQSSQGSGRCARRGGSWHSGCVCAGRVGVGRRAQKSWDSVLPEGCRLVRSLYMWSKA